MITSKFKLVRVRLNSGGYDSSGSYWGVGSPLYFYNAETTETKAYGRCVNCGYSMMGCYDLCADNSGPCEFPTKQVNSYISEYLRANSREHAKSLVRAKYPDAKFYN